MKTAIFAAAVALSSMAVQAQAASPNEVDVVAIVKVQSQFVDQFKSAAYKLMIESRLEAGNVQYDFDQSTDDPTEFVTSEKWASEAILNAHMHGQNLGEFFAIAAPMMEKGYPVIKTLKTIDLQ